MLANYDLADYSENEIARAAQKIVDFLGYYDKNRTGQKSNSGAGRGKIIRAAAPDLMITPLTRGRYL